MKYKKFLLDEITLVFGLENDVAVVTAIPAGKEEDINEEKMCGVDPLGRLHYEPALQISLEGDGYLRDFSAGKTHRNQDTSFSFGLPKFTYLIDDEKITLQAECRSKTGLRAIQYYEKKKGINAFVTYCEVINESGGKITIESAPSFNITRISPFERYNQDAHITLYRMRSNWSGEGTLESREISEFALEDSWGGVGSRMEKIGQRGSMPANGWLPWVAVEDNKNDCTWAVQLEAPGSWQIEVANVWGGITICGGLADYTYGHWNKTLDEGERFITHKAYVTVCSGGVEKAARNLIRCAELNDRKIDSDFDLPIIYNEYCYTWGQPTQEKIDGLLPLCKDMGIDYFVLDAGWYREEGKSWESLGDWKINSEYFPEGLKGYVRACEQAGLGAGIWFEFESVSNDSRVAKEHPDWLLTYKGKVICHQGRCMLDFRKKEVIEHLRKKVIGQIKEAGIRYLKVDYNESIGIGVDGAESLGEGLREHMECVIAFFRELIRELPELIVEICSSGGMRHEPIFLSLGSMCSFSDAHECPEGAVIASNLHRFIPPRKLQIWATIRDEYGEPDTYFTLAKSMLGRMCISGNLLTKTENILSIIKKSIQFYQKIKDIIRDGETVEINGYGTEYLSHICGAQWLKRVSLDKKRALVYFFTIENKDRFQKLEGFSEYDVEDCFGNMTVNKSGDEISFQWDTSEHAGCVVLLKRK